MSRLTYERHPEQEAPHTTADPLPGNNQWSRKLVYNGQSLVQDVTDARAVTTHFEYDGQNRVKEVTYSDGTPTVVYTYDVVRNEYYPAENPEPSNRGRLTSVLTKDASNNRLTMQRYDYNALGQVVFQTQQHGLNSPYVLKYTYDLAGQVKTETYPSGRVVSYS